MLFIGAAQAKLLEAEVPLEVLKAVYLQGIPAFDGAGESLPVVSAGQWDHKRRTLVIPVTDPRVPPPSERDWVTKSACKRDQHGWDYKTVTGALVGDVPFGHYTVQLKVVRTVYRCRHCNKSHSPWPDGLMMVPFGHAAEDYPRITQRLFEFFLELWTSGHTFVEMAELTGVSLPVVRKVINLAPAYLESLGYEEELPSVIGIDEIYLHGRYYTVITDLSVPGRTTLIDFAWDRVGVNTLRKRRSPKEKAEKEKKVPPPEGAVLLSQVFRGLARRFVKESLRRGLDHVLTPIVTVDGWKAFHTTVHNAFRREAEAARLPVPEVLIFPDIWHLQKTLMNQVHRARDSLDWNVDQAKLDMLERLRQMESPMRAVAEITDPLLAEEFRKDYRQAVRGFNIVAHRYGLPAELRWPETDTWRITAFYLLEAHRKRLAAEFEELRKQGHAAIDDVRWAGVYVLTANSSVDRSHHLWVHTIRRYDEHPLTRWRDAGFGFTTLDIQWSDINTFLQKEMQALRKLATILYVVRTVTDESGESHDIRDSPGIKALIEKYEGKEDWAVNPDGVAGTYARTVVLNEGVSLPASELFRVQRPTNSRTERLNGSVRPILLKSQPLTRGVYVRLRTRVLLALSGRFRTTDAPRDEAQIPTVELPPPTFCPRCGKKKLKVMPDQQYGRLCQDIPIGWTPVRYLALGQRWRCGNCGKESGTTVNPTRAGRSDALAAYVQFVASKPRLGPLSISTWSKRTGIARSTLRPLLRGAVAEEGKISEGPARIISVSLTSDRTRKETQPVRLAASEFPEQPEGNSGTASVPPRVMLLNLRHWAPGEEATKRLKPARVIAHERMDVEQIIDELAVAHQAAGAGLIVLLDSRTLAFREQLQASSEGRWLLATDPHNAKRKVKTAARNLYWCWHRNTRTPARKDKRTHRSAFKIPNDRPEQMKKMRRFLISYLGEELKKKEASAISKYVIKPHELPGPEYAAEDILPVRNYLRKWWRLILKFKKLGIQKFRRKSRTLLHESPAVKGTELQKILHEFQTEMRELVQLLENSLPNHEHGPTPNTHTGHYHTGQVGGIRNKLLQVDSARRFQPT